MSQMHTVAAIATPPGTGGIAVIRISGPDTYTIGSKVFVPKNNKKSLAAAAGYTAMFGRFIYRGAAVDEGIVLCFRAPHSYTGEDVLELSCHGGEEVAREVLQACIEAGAQPATPGEFTKRAVLNGRMGLTQAEAVMDLIAASSRQAVALAGSALAGALQTKIGGQKQALVKLAGHLAAYTDYPEEDVDTLTKEVFLDTVQTVKAQLQTMIDQYQKGHILRRGVTAAIVGSPNVGKSTLFNLLAGGELAIVTPVAGTTRDVVRGEIQLGGVTLHLADTAGLRKTQDIVEQEGIRRSYAAMEEAAFVVAVFDGTGAFSQQDLHLAQLCGGRPSIAIVNKSDLGINADISQIKASFTKVVVTSAKSGDALQIIEDAVREVLGLANFDPDAALLANARQLGAVVQAKDALQQAEETLLSGITFDAAGVFLDDALYALASLTGENASDAVIDEVFSTFCVGK